MFDNPQSPMETRKTNFYVYNMFVSFRSRLTRTFVYYKTQTRVVCFHGKSYGKLIATSLDFDIVHCLGGVLKSLKSGISDLNLSKNMVGITSCMCSWPKWTISKLFC